MDQRPYKEQCSPAADGIMSIKYDLNVCMYTRACMHACTHGSQLYLMRTLAAAMKFLDAGAP